jgi:hypothetical protein
MNITRWILLSALVMISLEGTCQLGNHLVLRKNGFRNKINYLTGDPISFMREGSSNPEEYYLQGIGTDFIVVAGQELPLNKITCIIKHRTGFNFRASGKALMIAAPGYLVIGVINSLFQGSSPAPTATNLIVAGSLLTAGLILPGFQVRKYPLGKKFSLIIVQSDPALDK